MSLYRAHCRAVLRFYRYTFMGAEQHRQNITFPDWDITSEREKNRSRVPVRKLCDR